MHGVDTFLQSFETDGTTLHCCLSDRHALQVVDRRLDAIFSSIGIDDVASHAEIYVFRLILAERGDARSEAQYVEQALIGIDLTVAAFLALISDCCLATLALWVTNPCAPAVRALVSKTDSIRLLRFILF